jgi:cytochrome P450
MNSYSRLLSTLARGAAPVSNATRFLSDPLAFLERLSGEGDLVPFTLLNKRAVFVNAPDLIDSVLVRGSDNYTKSDPFWRAMQSLMGDGVATGEGENWAAQRRPVQQVFDRHSFEWSTPLIVAETEQMLDSWRTRAPFDVGQAMRELHLRIGALLISGSDDSSSQVFGDAFEAWHEETARFARCPFPPLSWPTPGHTRRERAAQAMDDSLFSMMMQRVQYTGKKVGHDVLSQLLASADRAPVANPRRLRNNIMTLRLGTYENQSTTLSWAWHWLTLNRQYLERAVDEARDVLRAEPADAAAVEGLAFTGSVLRETLRLSPSIWLLMRRAERPDLLGGHHIPAGTITIISPYTAHRNPRYWPDPTRFDPDRFAAGAAGAAGRPYIPFGKGPHSCLASTFAMHQMTVIMATVLRRFDLRPVSGPPVGATPLISMRPSRPVMVTAHEHVASAA